MFFDILEKLNYYSVVVKRGQLSVEGRDARVYTKDR